MTDEETSAILGVTKTCRTHVDGTIVFQIEVEPRHAAKAFGLFGMPGAQVALARIMPEAALRETRKETEADLKPRGGALCKLAGIFCNDEKFREWLRITYDPLPRTAEDAATIIRNVCGVASRAELDHDEAAAANFHQQFRLPYSAWLDGRNK